MIEKNSYIVYMHINKINQKKYIGITSQSANNRWRNGKGYCECPKFYNAINKYGWENFEHQILYIQLTKEQAEEKEKELIAKYKTNEKEYGYNISNGGNSIGKMSDETKIKISNSARGRKFSEDHKRKIGLAQLGPKNHNYGKNISNDIRLKMSIGQLNHPNSSQFKAKKVNQYDLQGNLIKTWNSMGEIKRSLGISHCMISDCCRGKQHTAGGFIWKYCCH